MFLSKLEINQGSQKLTYMRASVTSMGTVLIKNCDRASPYFLHGFFPRTGYIKQANALFERIQETERYSSQASCFSCKFCCSGMDQLTAVTRTEWSAEPVRNIGKEGCQSTEVMGAVCSKLVCHR